MQGERPARERSCALAVSVLSVWGEVADTSQQLDPSPLRCFSPCRILSETAVFVSTAKPIRIKEDILACTAAELNYGLAQFVKEITRPNGERYEPDSIYYLCLGIQQVREGLLSLCMANRHRTREIITLQRSNEIKSLPVSWAHGRAPRGVTSR